MVGWLDGGGRIVSQKPNPIGCRILLILFVPELHLEKSTYVVVYLRYIFQQHQIRVLFVYFSMTTVYNQR